MSVKMRSSALPHRARPGSLGGKRCDGRRNWSGVRCVLEHHVAVALQNLDRLLQRRLPLTSRKVIDLGGLGHQRVLLKDQHGEFHTRFEPQSESLGITDPPLVANPLEMERLSVMAPARLVTLSARALTEPVLIMASLSDALIASSSGIEGT